jgi:hypothetical protein
MTDTSRKALINALRIKATLMDLGEKIAWGSDTTLMRQAANMLEAKTLTHDAIRTAGGIVHADGNIFFTNLDKLNAAIKEATT